MAECYPYLIASLPMLHYGMKPPFSFERFLEVCRPLIPKKDFHILRFLPKPEHYPATGKRHVTVQKWIDFDSALRNELVRIRAAKKQLAPLPYLQPDHYRGPSLAPAIIAATMNTTVLDAEKILDETRWKVLEDLGTGHYFDLAALIVYAYKLLILQRWEKIRSADGMILLDHALQH